MVAVPMSHQAGQIDHIVDEDENSTLPRKERLKDETIGNVKETKHPISLNAGEMSLHHPRLYHRSGANSTLHPRIVVAIRYMPARAAPYETPDYATLINGRYEMDRGFEMETGAVETMGENEVKMHKKAHDRLKEIQMQCDTIVEEK